MKLIVYRLYNSHYGDSGNPLTLSVGKNEDNTISYSLYSGWQNSGMGHSIGNLQMKKSLPMTIRGIKNVQALDREIQQCLMTGCGSSEIKESIILNTFDHQKPIDKDKIRTIIKMSLENMYMYAHQLKHVEKYEDYLNRMVETIMNEIK